MKLVACFIMADLYLWWVKGRLYEDGRDSILLGCLHVFRAVGFCLSFSRVARYALLWKTKAHETIAANPSTLIDRSYL